MVPQTWLTNITFCIGGDPCTAGHPSGHDVSGGGRGGLCQRLQLQPPRLPRRSHAGLSPRRRRPAGRPSARR
jgi:hypothetical protein